MKRFIALAAAAFVVLAAASVWLGGLNQDEGWYLYAAQLVRDGRMPYRDFFFTQGPLMPVVYSFLVPVWTFSGLLGARVATCLVGLGATVLFACAARALVPGGRRLAAAAVVLLLLGNNLYHVYYTTIPKTYALASFFVAAGALSAALAASAPSSRRRAVLFFLSGAAFAFAAGARLSLGALLAVFGVGLLAAFRTFRFSFVWFGLGGALALGAVFGPFLLDDGARAGLVAAQNYHLARGSGDVFFTLGSLSRLVRWYAPVFVLTGLGVAAAGRTLFRLPGDARGYVRLFLAAGFLAVVAVQTAAPYPYEDYQVPAMGLEAVVAAALCLSASGGREGPARPFFFALLALGLSWSASFGSPLLERWTTDGADRFWTLRKEESELARLRRTAAAIEALDPGGKDLLTQDLYLAVEARRRVPDGLEMGPFSILSDESWRRILATTPCRVAALSGYSFAIDPPRCGERPIARQLEFWTILKKRYDIVMREERFGQNATPLLVLRLKDGAGGKEAGR